MNKFILRTVLFVAVVAVAGLGAYKAQVKKPVLSDLMMANVEALSNDEIVVITCSQKCNDGIGRCWIESEDKYCVMTGGPDDNCWYKPCRTIYGDIY